MYTSVHVAHSPPLFLNSSHIIIVYTNYSIINMKTSILLYTNNINNNHVLLLVHVIIPVCSDCLVYIYTCIYVLFCLFNIA